MNVAAWIFKIVSLSVMISAIGCGDVKFAASGDGTFVGSSILQNGHRLYRIIQPLQQTQVRPLDIVWIVDNSGSMSTEAAHVRTNLTNFVQRLSSVNDVQIALISTIGDTGTATRLPATNLPKLEINQNVNSNDALMILQSAICPASGGPSACGALPATYAAVRGRLNGFLRQNSQKVFVIVTDDESRIAQTAFKTVYDSIYSPTSLNVFGWIGLGAAESSCQAATGSQYMALAQATGGQFFNVCDNDWTARFNQLASNVVTLVMDTISLPQEILHARTIFKVTLNGRELSASDFSFSNTGIILSPSVRQGLTSADISIEYE